MIKSKYIPELIMSVLLNEIDNDKSLDSPFVRLEYGRAYSESYRESLTREDLTAVSLSHLREVLNDIFEEEEK